MLFFSRPMYIGVQPQIRLSCLKVLSFGVHARIGVLGLYLATSLTALPEIVIVEIRLAFKSCAVVHAEWLTAEVIFLAPVVFIREALNLSI